MRPSRRTAIVVLVAALVCLQHSLPASSQTASSRGVLPQPPASRDGQHDFDFHLGTWKAHVSRRLHVLSGDSTWAEYDGTGVVRPLWNGRANLLEQVVDGPAGHLEGLSLRLYNPQSHQWSLNYANARSGAFDSIPTVGSFEAKNGRGEFYDIEPVNGRTILVRNVFSNITADSCRFEQAFSADWGKTWEVNWITVFTR